MSTDRPPSDSPRDGNPLSLEDLVAYLDGELDDAESEAVEARVTNDPASRTEAETLRRTWELLDYLPRAEASSNFTSRTMERLDAVPGRASDTMPMGASRGRLIRVASIWAALIAVAILSGYWGTRALFPTGPVTDKNIDALSIADLRVVENLPLYRHVPDVAFLRELNASDWFADEAFEFTPPTEQDRQEYLRVQLAEFQSLPRPRRDELRQLDHDLLALPHEEQEQLRRVMIDYAGWASSLSESRLHTLAALPPRERANEVYTLRQQQWVAALPSARRQQWQQATPQEQARLTEIWRQADRQWREEWRWAAQYWTEIRANVWPLPLHNAEFRQQLHQFIDTRLRPELTDSESARLDLAVTALEQGNLIRFARTLVDLSDRHPVLPGPLDGPKSFSELPAAVQEYLLANGIRPEAPALQRDVGQWPEYAIAVTEFARKRSVELPVQLGPSRPEEFDPPIPEVIDRLMRALNRQRSEDRNRLQDAEGQWPEYPRLIYELAQREGIEIPGVTLPGDSTKWDRFRRRR